MLDDEEDVPVVQIVEHDDEGVDDDDDDVWQVRGDPHFLLADDDELEPGSIG